jgi:hypothetical protein
VPDLPPRWPPERASAYSAMLQMPYGAEWVAIWNREPARPGESLDLFLRRGLDPDHIGYRFTVPPEEARPMLGLTFEMFGRLTSIPVSGGWQIQPVGELDHELNIDRWWMEVPIAGAAAARRQRAPDGRVRKWLEILDNTWSPDGDLIARALMALEMTVGRTGRKRLEESPSSPWRAYAEQARELLATKEVRTIREAAARLMIDYGSLNDDPIAEAKAERAAEVRLGNYLRKLRDLGE